VTTSSDVGICLGTLLPDPMTCDEPSFAAITRAAGDAGFATVSLFPFHAQAIGMDRTEALLADAGLRVRAVEGSTEWVNGATTALRTEVDGLLEAADRFGAGVVGACTLDPGLASFDLAVEGFAALCEQVGAHGMDVSLEFLPWTGIPDLAMAWRIVEGAGHDAGGILLDTWHWQRQPGGPALDLLRGIPGRCIRYVQVSDTAPDPVADLWTETMSDRRLPGEGTVDYAPVFATLAEIGAEPFVATEIFSAALVAQGPATAARRMRDAFLAAVEPVRR
jgi:sugar phosphate isomerase/epimerase